MRNHQELSKKKQQYFDADLDENGKPYGNYIPYVVETSVGADRLFLATFCNAYTVESVGEGESAKEADFPETAPGTGTIQGAVLPLVKKDGLAEKAQALANSLKSSFRTVYDSNAAIR